MSAEQTAGAVFLVVALTLPLSALIARGLPRQRVLKLVLIWGLIFLAVATIAGLVAPRLHLTALHNTYYQTERAA